MRSLGKGHTTAKRFCALNMPPPPQPTAYRACNIALAKATKAVAVKAMRDAANELRNNPSQEINTSVMFPAMEHGTDGEIVHEWVCHKTVNMNGKCLQYRSTLEMVIVKPILKQRMCMMAYMWKHKECVRHVQKRVGTAMQKFKKKEKLRYWGKEKANRYNDR